MKRLLMCTDGSAYSEVGYNYAAWAAQRLDAAVDVLYVTDVRQEQALLSQNLSGSLGLDSYQGFLEELVEIERAKAKLSHKRSKAILGFATEAITARGVNADRIKTTHATGTLMDSLHERESNADLVVLGKRGETADFDTEHLGHNLERMVRSSSRPCLVTPREYQPIERVLLAYDDGPSCQKAVQFMATSPLFTSLDIHVVLVAKTSQKAVEEEANATLKQAVDALSTGGLTAQAHVLHGNPEDAIADYVKTHSINLLVVGAYGHRPLRRLMIGSTTVRVMRRSHIPVLMYR